MTIVQGGNAELSYKFLQGNGHTSVSSIGIRCGTGVDWDTAGPLVLAAWAPMADQQSEIIGAISLTVRQGTSDPSAPVVYEFSGGLTGAGIESETPQNALLVRKQTAAGGRKNRGRMFIPGVPEAQCTSFGQLNIGYQDDVQNALDQWREDAEDAVASSGGALVTFVLLHSSETDEPTEITALSIEGMVATQRRRLVR